MADLARRPALAGREPLRAGGWTLAPRQGMAVCRVTAHGAVALPGAIRLGPGELLVLDRAGDGPALLARIAQGIGGTALATDAAPGLVLLSLHGPEPLDVLGLGALSVRPGEAVTTRLADLRVTLVREAADALLLIAERPAAEYLWQWLAHRLHLAAAA